MAVVNVLGLTSLVACLYVLSKCRRGIKVVIGSKKVDFWEAMFVHSTVVKIAVGVIIIAIVGTLT